MSCLPKGWASVEFSQAAEVTDYVANGSFAALKENVQYREEGYAILVRLTDWKKKWKRDFVYVDEHAYQFLSKSSLVAGDIVISCVGEPGQVFRVPELGYPMTLGPNSVRIRENTAIFDKNFFTFFWRSKVGQDELAKIITGTTQQKFNKTGLRASSVLVAPLPEQKRIADKLDATLARVDACRERLARVAPILKRFRQSVLTAATSGQLTADWREQQGHGHAVHDDKSQQGNAHAGSVGWADEGSPTSAAHGECWASQAQPNLRADSASGSSDPCTTEVLSGTQVHQQIQFVDVKEPYSHRVTAPLSWVKSTIGEMVDIIGGSQPPKSVFQTSPGEGLIRLIQIRDYKSDKHLTYIPISLAKRFCSETDVMIGRYGPPIFQILRGLEGAYNVALMKAQPKNSGLDLDYLFHFLKGDLLLKYIEAGSDRTAGQDGVRKELVLSYPMFVPPLAEQTEIVRRVETLLAFADRLEARLASASAAAERLTPSLLAKAFRGELVPQDPNDEPASELLKRLAAQREAMPKAKRGKKSATAAGTA